MTEAKHPEASRALAFMPCRSALTDAGGSSDACDGEQWGLEAATMFRRSSRNVVGSNLRGCNDEGLAHLSFSPWSCVGRLCQQVQVKSLKVFPQPLTSDLAQRYYQMQALLMLQPGRVLVAVGVSALLL